jgi:hypothetical protein
VVMVDEEEDGIARFRLPPRAAIARSRSASFSSMKSLRVRFLTFPALLRSPRLALSVSFSFCSLICTLSFFSFSFPFSPFLRNAPGFTFSLSSTIISSSPSPPPPPPVLEFTSSDCECELVIKAGFIVPVLVSVCEEEVAAARSSFNAFTRAVFGCSSPVAELELEWESIAVRVDNKAPFVVPCSVEEDRAVRRDNNVICSVCDWVWVWLVDEAEEEPRVRTSGSRVNNTLFLSLSFPFSLPVPAIAIVVLRDLFLGGRPTF